MQLIFATNNKNKINEIAPLVNKQFNLITLAEAGIDQDIEEPFDTLEENALIKATTIFNLTNINCFAEDTGLLVEALKGEPGVKSARYAGEQKSDADNIQKLLNNLEPFENRAAKFVTVIALLYNQKTYLFTGECEGVIATTISQGKNGFGYDPVFIPNGSSKAFADMSLEEKSLFSHRKKATAKLLAFLNNL